MSNINPYLVSDISASGKALTPIPVKEKAFQEEWLQELLFKHPSILPVNYVHEDYVPLVSIGREIASIDNLFISPSGLLTVVETKLWRNPEAHRTVVAQILEYAKTLTSWNYDRLDQAVSSDLNRRTGESLSIFGAVKKHTRNFELSEIEFQAKVQESISNGRFALLVVGDRIFPEATQLAEIIQSAPHLQFSLGFVELRCYKLEKDSSWPLVIVPNFVAKTREFTRAVVKVIYEEKKPDIQVEAIEEDVKPSRTNLAVFTASLPSDIKDAFKSYIERWMKAGYTIYWGKVGFSLRIQWKGQMITILDAYPGNTRIILTEEWARQYEFPEDAYQSYKDELMRSPTLGSYIAAGRKYVSYEDLTADDVALILYSVDKFAAELHKKSTSGS
ncbi:MAG: hypothetical protein R6V59_02720 [Dehalococcoidia bacterium]